MFVNINIKTKYIILVSSIIIFFCLFYVLYKDNFIKKENYNQTMNMIKNLNPLDATFNNLIKQTQVPIITTIPTS